MLNGKAKNKGKNIYILQLLLSYVPCEEEGDNDDNFSI